MKSYLNSVIKQFEYYKSLGDKTFKQLTFDEIKWQSSENSNNIAIITKHLVGNMLSRWTHFLTEDGEKTWRKRDEEFIDDFKTLEELIAAWESGWQCLFDALKPLESDDLLSIVYIRNQEHTVIEAINRQLAHYAYHIGQIVYIGKLIRSNNWSSLSIPKGESNKYNQDKFSQQKSKKHDTDNL